MMMGHDRRQATCTRMALGSGLGMVEQWSAGAYRCSRCNRQGELNATTSSYRTLYGPA